MEAGAPGRRDPSLFRVLLARIHPVEYLALLALALALAGIGNVVDCAGKANFAFPCVDAFKLHQFVFGYDDLGFAKRSLFGTLLGLDPASAPEALVIRLIATAILLVVAALLVALSFALPRPLRLAMVLSPAVFLQAGYDLGRLDQLNYVILVLILLSGRAGTILLAPLMVLAHEGAFLIHLPTLFAAHRMIHGESAAARAALALSAAALALVLLFGNLDPDFEIGLLYPHVTPEIYAFLARDLPANLAFLAKTAGHFTAEHLVHLGIAVAYAALVFHALRPHLPEGRAFGLPLWLAAFSPLLLSAVGIDWPRWIAAAILNLFLLAAVASVRAPERAAPASAPAALLPAFALLGPVGAAAALPLLHMARETLF